MLFCLASPQYVGCYIDGENRDLAAKPLYYSNGMQIQICHDYCDAISDKGFYFGIQVNKIKAII